MLKHHLITSLHTARRHRASTAINLLALTIGLACFMAGYAVVKYWSMSDQQYIDSRRTYAVTQDISYRGAARLGKQPRTAYHAAKYLKEGFPELTAIARLAEWSSLPMSVGEKHFSLRIAGADPDFLRIFRRQSGDPAIDALSSPRTAVLKSETARRIFGGEPAIGKSFRLGDDIDVRVTGIFDPPTPSLMDSDGYARFDLLVSWDLIDELLARTQPAVPDTHRPIWFATCCMLFVQFSSEHPPFEALRPRLDRFVERHVPAEQLAFADMKFDFVPLNEVQTTELARVLFASSGVRVSIKTALIVVALLVLAIAIVNCANLLAAQVAAQAGQLGVRKILGANRRSLAMQCAVDAGLYVLCASVLAIGLTTLILPSVGGLISTDVGQILGSVNYWLAIGLVLSGVIPLIAGYPALVALSIRPAAALQSIRGRARRSWFSSFLVGSQFAVATALIALILVIRLQHTELRETAFATSGDQLVVIANRAGSSSVSMETLATELRRISGVRSVTSMEGLPWDIRGYSDVLSPSADTGAPRSSGVGTNVSYDFFPTMNIALLAGRTFDRSHDDAMVPLLFADPAKPMSVIIDRAMSSQLGFANPADAVGKIFYRPTPLPRPPQPVRIIGVVEDKPMRLTGSGSHANSYYLMPTAATPIIRVRGDHLATTLEQIDTTWRRLMPSTPIQRQFLDELFGTNYRIFERIGTALMMFTLAALTIALLGLIGTTLHVVTHRRFEIGVRKTLGASALQVLALLLRELSTPIVIAGVLAWPAAFAISQLYLNIFVHRASLTIAPFAASLLITLFVAWIAVSGQTWRAARLKPADVLRHE